MRLRNDVIIVTGGSGGIGRAMAEAFVAEGARVAIASRTDTSVREAAEAMDGLGGDAIGVQADVREWTSVRRLIDTVEEAYGPVDVLVNNAGLTQETATGKSNRSSVADVSIDVWDTILDTNLRGAFLCTKAVLPSMLERDAGRVIHISSGMGRSGRANRAPYVASKFGLEGFCESLALELEGTAVESVVLRPPGGGVYTESREHLGAERYDYQDPSMLAEAAVQLASGEGRNGGRYVGRADGTGFGLDE